MLCVCNSIEESRRSKALFKAHLRRHQIRSATPRFTSHSGRFAHQQFGTPLSRTQNSVTYIDTFDPVSIEASRPERRLWWREFERADAGGRYIIHGQAIARLTRIVGRVPRQVGEVAESMREKTRPCRLCAKYCPAFHMLAPRCSACAKLHSMFPDAGTLSCRVLSSRAHAAGIHAQSRHLRAG